VARLSALTGRLHAGLAAVAAIMLLGMVVVVTGDILLRNVTRGGLTWANEVSEYALYLTTLLVAPWLLRQGRHVRIDIVLVMLPARLAWTLELVADVIGFAVCLAIVRYGLGIALDSWSLGAITIKNLVFPEYWLLVPLPLCFALLALEFAFRFHRLLTGERRRRVEATSAG
jgi:TRAP-type C4-dicarboxylate transport system permease small subunit